MRDARRSHDVLLARAAGALFVERLGERGEQETTREKERKERESGFV